MELYSDLFFLKEIFSVNRFGLSDLTGFKATEMSFFGKSSLEAKFKRKEKEMGTSCEDLGYFSPFWTNF